MENAPIKDVTIFPNILEGEATSRSLSYRNGAFIPIFVHVGTRSLMESWLKAHVSCQPIFPAEREFIQLRFYMKTKTWGNFGDAISPEKPAELVNGLLSVFFATFLL